MSRRMARARLKIPFFIALIALIAPMMVALGAGGAAAQDATPAAAAYDPASVDAWLADIKAKYEGQTIVMSVSEHPSTTATILVPARGLGDVAAPFHRLAHRELVGILQVAADGDPGGDAGDADAERPQEPR